MVLFGKPLKDCTLQVVNMTEAVVRNNNIYGTDFFLPTE